MRKCKVAFALKLSCSFLCLGSSKGLYNVSCSMALKMYNTVYSQRCFLSDALSLFFPCIQNVTLFKIKLEILELKLEILADMSILKT